jgi:hypothetical protein
MWHLWEKTDACTEFLVGKPEGKSMLGRPRRRWNDNMKRKRMRCCRLDSFGFG